MEKNVCSFECNEDKVSYFLYMHEEEDYSIDCGDAYLSLDPSIIKRVERRAILDFIENRGERSPEQLGDYLSRADLLNDDRVKDVVYDLHRDYSLAYRAERGRTDEIRRRYNDRRKGMR